MPTLPLFDPSEMYPTIPDYNSVVNDALLDNLGDEEDFKIVDTNDPNNIYIGYVEYTYDLTVQPPQQKLVGSTADPVWKIIRINQNAGIITRQYANGNRNYTNIWDNRAALAYS